MGIVHHSEAEVGSLQLERQCQQVVPIRVLGGYVDHHMGGIHQEAQPSVYLLTSEGREGGRVARFKAGRHDGV